MKLIKQIKQYKVMDCRASNYQGPYQILDVTENYPYGETCEVYKYKKDALIALKKLIGAKQ